MRRLVPCWGMAVVVLLLLGLISNVAGIGEKLKRKGQEIMVCGQLFDIGTDVVLWTDPGGYDAYRTELRFFDWARSSWENYFNASWSPYTRSGPARFFPIRTGEVNDSQIPALRGGGWSLDDLTPIVRQFVIHYDVTAYSRRTFQVLHDSRGLSVHFMLDVDGTIYQTLDVKERAYHAGLANSRSVGIEVAHIGAYSKPNDAIFDSYYNNRNSSNITLRITNPTWLRNQSYIGIPARTGQLSGRIQTGTLYQYDFTNEQYASLAKLTAALAKIFPRIRIRYPTDGSGALRTSVLSAADQNTFEGLVGHYHVDAGKIDPGPAFNWDRLVNEATALYSATTSAAPTATVTETATPTAAPTCPACPTCQSCTTCPECPTAAECPTTPQPTSAPTCPPEVTCESCPTCPATPAPCTTAKCGSGSNIRLTRCPTTQTLLELRGQMAQAAALDVSSVVVPVILGCPQPTKRADSPSPVLAFYIDVPDASAADNAAAEQKIMAAANSGQLSSSLVLPPQTSAPTSPAVTTTETASTSPQTTASQHATTAQPTTAPVHRKCNERFWVILFIICAFLNVVLIIAVLILIRMYMRSNPHSPAYVNLQHVWSDAPSPRD